MDGRKDGIKHKAHGINPKMRVARGIFLTFYERRKQ